MPKNRAISFDAKIHLKTVHVIVLCAFLTAVPASVSALQLGELQVKSALGSPFSASIPVKLKDDEPFDASCVHLLSEGKQDASYLRQANVSVLRSKSSIAINIQTKYKLEEPLLRLAISVNCAGSSSVSRDYPVLLDPPTLTESSKPDSSAITALPQSRSPRFPGKKWTIRAGDTVNTLAQSLYPNDDAAQASFARQLLARYTDIQTPDEVIESSRVIYLPNVRHSIVAAPAIVKAPKASAPAVIKKPGVQSPLPLSAVPANTDRLELSSTEPLAESGLKLSYTLAPSTKNLNDAEKEALRQKLKLINSDDQLAYLIDLQSQLKQVHREMEGLKRGVPVVASPAVAVEQVASSRSILSGELASEYLLPGLAGLAALGILSGGWWYYRRKQSASQWSFDEFVPPPNLVGAAAQAEVAPMNGLSDGLLPAEDVAKDFGQDIGHGSAIVVEESDRWAVEEAQVYLSHGWIDHAVSLLKEEIEKNQYHLDLWIMLFEVLKQNHLVQEFDDLAVRFKEIAFGLPIWDQVVAMQADLRQEEGAETLPAEPEAPNALDVALDLDLAVEHSAEAPVLPIADQAEVAQPLDDKHILPFESVWLADEEPVPDLATESDPVDDIFNLDFPTSDAATLELDAPLSLVVGETSVDTSPSSTEVDFDLGDLTLSPMVSTLNVDSNDSSESVDELPEEIDYTNIDFDLTLDLPVESDKKPEVK